MVDVSRTHKLMKENQNKQSEALTLCLFVTLSLAPTNVLAQGVLNFANFGNGVDAPVSDWDGTSKLFGPTFAADLYWVQGIVTDSTLLSALNQPATFATNGYFFGGTRIVPGQQAGSTITVQVRVWDVPDGDSWHVAVTMPNARHGEYALVQGE